MYPLATRWSTKYHVKINTVNSNFAAYPLTYICPHITEMVEKVHVLDANIQKQLLAEYEQKSKVKSQQWAKPLSDKKPLINILFGQWDDATRTEIALGNI